MIEEQPEEHDSHQSTLADIFSQEEQPVRTTSRTRKRYAIYRSYMGGNCENCDEPLGLIEVEGGRDRHYCNDKCRVQHHRRQQREKKRAATLQFNSELREYWRERGIRGEVLLRLQEILLQYGKAAARAATDAVLVALVASEQAGSQEQFRLIDEILLGGEAVGFPEVGLDEFRVPDGVEGWTNFVSSCSISMLRQMRGYLIERQQHDKYKTQGRKRLEELSHGLLNGTE